MSLITSEPILHRLGCFLEHNIVTVQANGMPGVAFEGRIGRARARKSPGDSDGLWDLVKIIKTFRETKPFDRRQRVNFRLIKRNPRDAGSAADLFLRL
jgi:hypothetical protein